MELPSQTSAGFCWTLVFSLLLALADTASAGEATDAPQDDGEAHWIWSPARVKDLVPTESCYFRRTFELSGGERATIQITCDDRYELFVNGKAVDKGNDWRSMKSIDVTEHLKRGVNSIAVKATNEKGSSAGLAARVRVITADGEASASTDSNWRTSLKAADGWQKPEFDDADWIPARDFGLFGPTAPWANQVAGVAVNSGRFLLGDEFRVEQVLEAEQTGSLISMAFNEWGEILAAREGGPLLLVVDKDEDGLVETVTTYCDEVKNCQGILPLNGMVYVVGDGPQGPALYRLSDDDQNGTAENVTALIEFTGEMGEHGPHATVLGPDGLIYIVVGNHSGVKQPYDPTSPHRNFYEGDLVQPRYEDANGHAVGIQAPGGVVIRTNIEGGFVQCFAGGLRNAYDMAFNREGELFTYDSDMEWDVGLPWYRPTRINHVVPGAEFGWRSGWAKWPPYFIDSLPAVLDTGRGSPTGIEVYNHHRFPARYHNALFACDWSQGRILAIKFKASGGGYTASSEVFLEGRPLNAVDLAVGPDGWLYFATGGRGTDGGVYRVVWTGNVPPQPKLKGVMQAIRQPQLASAWARQQVASLQQGLGDDWARQLNAVAAGANYPTSDRVRALELMQLVGPFPTTQALVKYSKDSHAELRAKAAYLMGIHSDDATLGRLSELLGDSDPAVRRITCEALVRSGQEVPPQKLIKLLADPNRYVAWAARRAIERLPVDRWATLVLDAENPQSFLVGAAALLTLKIDDETLDALLTRGSELMKGFLKDDDFVGLLRIFQRGLEYGKLTRKNVPDLCRQLADEYPANEPPDREQRINRELVRLLAYLQESSALERMIATLEGDAAIEEKLHVAFYLRFISDGWTLEQKLRLVDFYEQARALQGGHSYVGYLDNVTRDFVTGFNDEERGQVLAQAVRWPNTALLVLGTLPEKPDAAILTQLIELDDRIAGERDAAVKRLATGVVAVLGASGAPEAMGHLREQYERNPERREDLAMGLAQAPGGENWPVLLRSLAVVEDVAAQEVLLQLAKVDQAPDGPEPIRQVILKGLKLGENGAPLAIKLLVKWTGEQVSDPDDGWDVALAAWQKWFREKYPDELSPELPSESKGTKWTYQELLGFLTGDGATQGDASRGAEIFVQAQCIKCHRYGSRGEGVGPDLTTVGQRFQRKEILESILFPSQVVSDQYASKTVSTNDGLTYTGIVAPAGDDSTVILQSNGEKLTLAKSEIADTVPSKKSAMPEGLLDRLSLDDIADLFAYLGRPPRAAHITVQPSTKRRQ